MKRTLIAAGLVALTASGAAAADFNLQSAFGGLPVLDPTAKPLRGQRLCADRR